MDHVPHRAVDAFCDAVLLRGVGGSAFHTYATLDTVRAEAPLVLTPVVRTDGLHHLARLAFHEGLPL
jgi:hypothetical protein